MARKGMALGTGRGYKNIVGRDPAVHSQSAKGMKQPQNVNVFTPKFFNESASLFNRRNTPNSQESSDDYVKVRDILGNEVYKNKKTGQEWLVTWNEKGVPEWELLDNDKLNKLITTTSPLTKNEYVALETAYKDDFVLPDYPFSKEKLDLMMKKGLLKKSEVNNYNYWITEKGLESYKQRHKELVNNQFSGDQIKGGLGDNKPDSAFDKKELAKGIKVEMEHTNNPAIAKEVVKDHLTEFPKGYYEELDKMEKKLKKANKKAIKIQQQEESTKKPKLILIGHEGRQDIYEDEKGTLYSYSGNSEAEYQSFLNNPTKINKKLIVFKDKEGHSAWRHTSTKGAIYGKDKNNKTQKYSMLQYKEAVLSKGKSWNQMTKEEKLEFSDKMGTKKY